MASRYRADRRAAGSRRLGLVVGLPLLDGVFLTLVLAGALDSPAGIAVTGLVVFAGSAAAAIVLAECARPTGAEVGAVLAVGAIIVPAAAVQAFLAPTLVSLVDVELLRRFAALILVVVAIDLSGWRIHRRLPAPGALVLVALLICVDPGGELVVYTDPAMAMHGAAAATIGVVALLGIAVAGGRLGTYCDPRRLRSAGAAALVAMALATLGWVPTGVAMAALLVGLGVGVTETMGLRGGADSARSMRF